MYVHAKAKTRNQQASNGKKRCKEHMKRHKTDKHDRHVEQRSKDTSKQGIRQTKRIILYGTFDTLMKIII